MEVGWDSRNSEIRGNKGSPMNFRSRGSVGILGRVENGPRIDFRGFQGNFGII